MRVGRRSFPARCWAALGRFSPRTLGIAVVLALGVGGHSAFALQAEPSPAGGHAAVIAQGVAAMPGERLAWRVAAQRVRPLGQAPFHEWTLGFLLAHEVPLLLTEESAGVQLRLPPGEAAFVQPGPRMSLAALDPVPAQVLTLELVPAETVERDVKGTLIFASDEFPAPAGRRDVDLVRDVLRENEVSRLAGNDSPVLMFMVEGSAQIDIRGSDTDPQPLAEGEAGLFRGSITVVPDGEDGATFVAAVIGSPVPERPEDLAPSDDESGAIGPGGPGVITLHVRNCPAGMRPETLVGDGCAPATGGFEFALAGPHEGALTTAAAAFTDASTFSWSGLTTGDYALQETVLPPGHDLYSIPAGPVGYAAAVGYTFSLTTENPTIELTVYNFQPQPVAVDSDGDGLTDDREAELGTDPADSDSDDDGLPDGLEIEFESNPLRLDTDRDGLVDGDEYRFDTNPNSEDSDGDGLTDANEVDRGYDPANPDMDHDGLSDGEEEQIGTNAFFFDSDEDGFSDGAEVESGTDPLDPGDTPGFEVPPDVDSDADGLFDSEETDLGTNPHDPDSDNDGFTDGREHDEGSNPLNPNSRP